MRLSIQDDVIKRAIDFFGLRGVIPHDYESTIVPTVNVGNLGQRTLSIFTSGLMGATQFGPVPAGKTWRPIVLTARFTQAGGAVALVFAWNAGGILVPFFPAQTGVGTTTSLILRRGATLNTVNDTTLMFPSDLLVSEGLTIQPQVDAGDGALSWNGTLLVQELGEVLVSRQDV